MAHQSPRRSKACGSTLATFAMVLALTIIASGVLSACGNPTSAKTSTKTNTQSSSSNNTKRHLKFAVVADGLISDPFWSVVKRGIDQAATDMGVTVTYQAPDPYSVPALSQLIDSAVATAPDGLVVSIPDCAGLSAAIKRAQLIGIPVISINSGSDCASKLGLLNYIGQTDYQAGLASGQKLIANGAKHVLCVNEQVGNPNFDARCRGVSDALKQARGKSQVLSINLSNQTVAQQSIQTTLAQNPSIDAVITLGSTSASLAIAAAQHPGHLGQIRLATFGLSTPVFQAIEQGTMLFAIDQQPYLQGYLPIVLLTLYKTNLNAVTAPIIPTGLNFVTQDNVAQVQQLAAAGTR